MAVKFIADSSCDLWTYENIDFSSAPLTITTDEREFRDDETLDTQDLLEHLLAYKGRSQTACPSVGSWLESFGEADRIYIITMTSTLSGTYNSAMTAVEIYRQSHPNVQIRVFDTLSTGPEMRLLLEKLIELEEQGLSFAEVCEKAEQYQKKTRLFFALKSLHNLSQNGRISKVLASAVGKLGISIVGTASEEGTLMPVGKCRGEKKVVSAFVEQIEKMGYHGGKIRISHVENLPLAEGVKNALHQKYPQADIKIYPAHGLCSYYAEKGGILVGCES